MNTAKITAAYRFTRDYTSPAGFMSKQRPSTDAMNVLANWEALGAGRMYDVVEDADDYLVAKLSFLTADTDKAATGFNSLCATFGIKHEVVLE